MIKKVFQISLLAACLGLCDARADVQTECMLKCSEKSKEHNNACSDEGLNYAKSNPTSSFALACATYNRCINAEIKRVTSCERACRTQHR